MNRVEESIVCLGLAVGLASAASSLTLAVEADDAAKPAPRLEVLLPSLDPQRGKELFVEKKCVICHSVNGVGGLAAVALDAADDSRTIDILDFAARMWRGSYAMIELQATEFAYQIDLEGDEIGDLAAFAYDLEAQKTFNEFDIPEDIKEWILTEPISVDGGLFSDDDLE